MIVVVAPPKRISVVSTALARRKLGVLPVVAFVMAAAAPLTVVAGSASTGYAVTGFIGVPVVYLAVGGVLTLFSVGYVAMGRRIMQAGGFYAYIVHGLGRSAGVAAAFVALAGYNLLQVSLYGAFGVVASAVAGQAGWTVPWWACALGGWMLVPVLGLRSVTLNGRIVGVLLVAETLLVLAVDTMLLTHPASGTVSLAGINPASLRTRRRRRSWSAGWPATSATSPRLSSPRRSATRNGP